MSALLAPCPAYKAHGRALGLSKKNLVIIAERGLRLPLRRVLLAVEELHAVCVYLRAAALLPALVSPFARPQLAFDVDQAALTDELAAEFSLLAED